MKNASYKEEEHEITSNNVVDWRVKNLERARFAKIVQDNLLKPPYAHGHKFSVEDKRNILHIYNTLETNGQFKTLQGLDLVELTALLYGTSKETVKKALSLDDEGVAYDDKRKNRFIQAKDIPLTYKSVFENQIKTGS